ncbi:MAG: RNA polymerase sigma factor RpoD/SigA [bacterium]|nr:RNA polymerase sigma factor RpoD/SigA [bacterium]
MTRKDKAGRSSDPLFVIIRTLGLRKKAGRILASALNNGFIVRDDIASMFFAKTASDEQKFNKIISHLFQFFEAHNVVVLKKKPTTSLSPLFPAVARKEKKNDDGFDLFSMYTADIRRSGASPILNDDETKELARKYRDNGDTNALSKIIEHNLRFVISVAKRYRGYGLEYMDLIQEGNKGLIKAAKRFDHTRKNTFATYAYLWVEQKILRACIDQADLIRLPEHIKKYSMKVQKLYEELSYELRRPPTYEELAQELDDSVENVRRVMEAARIKIVSYDQGKEDVDNESDESQKTIEAWMGDSSLSPENLVMAREEWEVLLKELHAFFADVSAVCNSESRFGHNERNASMFKERYGFNKALKSATLEEVSQLFSLTRERVRQIADGVWLRLKSRGIAKDENWLLSSIGRLEELTLLLGIAKVKT